MYPEAGDVYVAEFRDDPGSMMYADLGMKFVEPDINDYYWYIRSGERYDSVGGDIVLHSERGFGPEELQKQPTFAAAPAGQGGPDPPVGVRRHGLPVATGLHEPAGRVAEGVKKKVA